ncbi:MAG: HAMP domain-containing protein, partial [Planctomycetota bacterium]|jgi:methyl-accepting chemotaxis protein
VDARGNVIARFPGLGPEHTGKPHPLPSLSRGAAGGDVTARAAAGHDGVRRLYGHAPLETGGPAKGNMVVLGIPEATVLGPIEDSLRQNLIWTTVVAVLALIIARWLGQQMIVERVNALILAMRRVALTELRDFHARGRVCQDPSELGDLERSFDIMAHALESRVNELDIREHAIEEAEHANDEDPAAEG